MLLNFAIDKKQKNKLLNVPVQIEGHLGELSGTCDHGKDIRDRKIRDHCETYGYQCSPQDFSYE